MCGIEQTAIPLRASAIVLKGLLTERVKAIAFGDTIMADDISTATQVSIREAGFDEFWLQDQIYNNLSGLGLGKMEAIQRERRQLAAGRLEILLKNPEDDAMYEVEVMLGQTDETHIIRAIEYWDNEKRRWPQRQHCAVLVAENINRRFFNVIHLLSNAIPIIAIQASLVESSGVKSLFFTTFLNPYEELDHGTAAEEQSYEQRKHLQRWVRSNTISERLARRAKMILLAAEVRAASSLKDES